MCGRYAASRNPDALISAFEIAEDATDGKAPGPDYNVAPTKPVLAVVAYAQSFADGVHTSIPAPGLGALGAGTHSFDWTLKQGVAASQVDGFRVNAQLGKTAVVARPYMRDRVEAVLTGGSQLTLELAGGVTVPYGQVKAFR